MDPDKSPATSQTPIRPLLVGAAVLVVVIALGAAWAQGDRVSPRNAQPAYSLPAAAPGPVETQTPEDRWIEWTASEGPKHFQTGEISIDIAATLNGDLSAAKITLTDVSGVRSEWIGDGAFGEGRAKFALVRLKPGDLQPQILLSSFSGGAHCCASLTLMRLDGAQWRQTDMGIWDGDTPKLPEDLDADGSKEFVFVDQVFLYAFASYAESWAPPVIKSVVSGSVRDVSDKRQFRPIFAEEAARSRDACLEKSNGACAAYVASAARAGNLDQAWAVMLQSYDQGSDWVLPTACRIRTAGECPADAQLTFSTFPEALQWFLGEHGYTPAIYIEPLRSAGPSFDCGGVAAPGELIVCADGNLATLDRGLAVVFNRVLALSTNRAALRVAQRTFLTERNASSEQGELRRLYETRINQLLAID